MTHDQKQWLLSHADRIPELFDMVTDGKTTAELEMGVRVVDGRAVRLSLLAEVVDPGRNPLERHASGIPPLRTV